MKTLLSLILLFLSISVVSYAQGSFWGSTYGFFGDGGIVYKIPANGSNVEVVKRFEKNDGDGAFPKADGVVLASDKKIYGVTNGGGLFDTGVIYSFDPATSEYKKLHDFNYIDAENGNPLSKLIEGEDGYIYGNRYFDNPKFFKIRKDGTGYEEFSTDTFVPGLNVFRFSDGNLYGVKNSNNSAVNSFIYKVTSPTTYVTIKELPTNYRATFMMQLPDGRMYYLRSDGQASNNLFVSMNLDGSDLAIESSLAGAEVRSINKAPNGKLYALIRPVPGIVSKLVELNFISNNYQSVYDFTEKQRTNDEVLFDDDYAYGTTRYELGSVDAPAIIYKVALDGSGISILTTLTNEIGMAPEDILKDNDKLYVVNTRFAANNFGSIVKVNTDGSGFDKMMDFFKPTDGMIPAPHFTVLPNGDLLGVTAIGGTTGGGNIYTIDHNNVFKVIYNFETYIDDNNFTIGPNGFAPFDAPIPGPDDFYYGTTIYGGANDNGIIYKIRKDGSGFQKIFQFDGANGNEIWSGLTLVNGRLYGMTFSGGADNEGVLYGVDIDGTNFQKLLDFDENPLQQAMMTKLVYRDDGFLYGCADALFRIKLNGSDYQTLFDTNSIPGDYFGTFADPFFDKNGDILLSYTHGGVKDRGAIFRVKSDGSSYELIHEFDVNLSQANVVANGNLAYGPDGLIYGLEPNGGPNGTGVMFTMKEDGSEYTRIELNIEGNSSTLSPWWGLIYVPDLDTRLVQEIHFTQPSSQTIGDPDVKFVATSSSGLEVTFNTTTIDKISIDKNTVSLLKAGLVSITANQDGNETYEAATPVTREFCINPAKPSITANGSTKILTSSNDEGNQWYLDGDLIPNATGKTYEMKSSGSYKVRTIVETCASEFSDEQIIEFVGLEKSADLTVRIFPNPASNEIFLRTSQPSNVSIIDITGRVIGQYVVNGNTDHRFEISSLAKGLYFLRIESGDSITTKRFSKL